PPPIPTLLPYTTLFRSRVFEGTTQKAFERWAAVNGSVQSLLPEPQRTISKGAVSKELLDYSFDRVIVTDKDVVAQFLIANNFHLDRKSTRLNSSHLGIS